MAKPPVVPVVKEEPLEAFERIMTKKLRKVLGPIGSNFLPAPKSPKWAKLGKEVGFRGRDGIVQLMIRGLKSLGE